MPRNESKQLKYIVCMTFSLKRLSRTNVEQAGAELCQAQFRLGFAKTAFHEVEIYSITNMGLSSINK
jgi:hypothetical protein